MTPERVNRIQQVLDKRQDDIAVILENVHNPHNISAIMRTCDAVGIQDIFIITNTIAPQKFWGRRSNAGAAGWMTIHQYTDVPSCIGEVRKRHSKIITTSLVQGAKTVFDIDFTENLAIVFGNEASGISSELMSFADDNFVIPQVGIIPSLNVSVSCAVSLYEALRQKSLAGHYNSPKISDVQLKNLSDKWNINE
jgi:tRNA (guanosine-2'-O-)-methyltransferase